MPYLRRCQTLTKILVLLLIMIHLILALTLVPDLILVLTLYLFLVHYLVRDPLLFLQGPQFPAYSQNSGFPVPFY